MSQYWFQCFKGFLFFSPPSPFLIFLCQFVQGACNVCEAFNEWVVKIEESQYILYFHDVFGYWPCVNSSNFYWVHASAKPGTHYRYSGPLQTTTDHYGPLYCLWNGPGFADVHVTPFSRITPR